MSAIFHQILYKIVSVLISLLTLIGVSTDRISIKADSSEWKTNNTCVFVHGLAGWGSYDKVYKLFPYWGMFGGELTEYLNDKGFDCYAASVDPQGSAWDRACELYAQLTGSVVDYGKEHSERCGHSRFGTDYRGKALIKNFDEDNKINLIGHSFGGTTSRLFATIMEYGSEAEMAVTDAKEISPFFTGGKGNYIYSITTLATPHNGSTAYTSPDSNTDSAAYDMYVDNALEMNEKIATLDFVYYFSFACNGTYEDENGNYVPDGKYIGSLLTDYSTQMGSFTGNTVNGYEIDDSWKMNDGLVNTKSALAPFNAPQKDFDAENIEPGVWNVMPVITGSHMAVIGGLTKVKDIKDFYVDHLSMINKL